MSSSALLQAVKLIKAGKQPEAQKLLEPLLQSDVHNVTAWMWYVETWPTIQQKIQVLESCARHNPDNEMVAQALAMLRAQQLQMQPKPDTPLPISRAKQTGKRGMGLWPFIIFLTVVALTLVTCVIIRLPGPNRNALAIGELATSSTLNIPIQPPAELDFKSKAEVLELRKEAVYQYPDLIVGEYKPSEAVFDQIVDGLPWWGIAGQFYYGSGEESIEGSAEESRFILNPYLLVAAEFHGMWDRNSVPEERVRQPGFLFYCAPRRLRWQPRAAHAEVSYDAQCVAQRGQGFFDLIVYNARDMNLNYIFVSYEDSYNISKQDPPTTPYAIPQFIHQGGSCGYSGGCNNMSPPTPEIDGLQITGLPARTVTWLWRQKPASLEQPPDMVFVIYFQ